MPASAPYSKQRFPEMAATEPEILAHHYTRAGLTDLAIDYWRKAGERALRASANVEGVTHLTHALDLVRSLPPTPERNRRELDVHLALGRMMRATKGYAASETLRVFSRARALLDDGATVNEHMTVLYGLWSVHYVRAEHAAAHEVARQCLALGERHPQSEAPAFAHMLTGHSFWAEGGFVAARTHLERTLALCGVGADDDGGERLPHNNAVASLAYLACTLWPLGYPEQAAAAAREAVLLARRIGHVPLTAYAMYIEVFLGVALGGGKADADSAVEFCVEHGVAAYEHWARFCQGLALARNGDPQAGIAHMRGAMEAAEKIDASMFRPLHQGHLGAVLCERGEIDVGLALLDDALATSQETGERFFDAELHRLRGNLLWQMGRKEEGEGALAEALDVSRDQKARLWELRAAANLARLRIEDGRRAEARDLLRPVYGWFEEGFDTEDLRQARAILDRLR